MRRFLVPLIILALFAVPAVMFWQDTVGKTRSDEEVYGCYVHPRFGTLTVDEQGVAYEGRSIFSGFMLTEAQGPLELVGRPNYRITTAGDRLQFDVIKDGFNARHPVPVRENGVERSLVLTAQPGDMPLAFVQTECAALPAP